MGVLPTPAHSRAVKSVFEAAAQVAANSSMYVAFAAWPGFRHICPIMHLHNLLHKGTQDTYTRASHLEIVKYI